MTTHLSTNSVKHIAGSISSRSTASRMTSAKAMKAEVLNILRFHIDITARTESYVGQTIEALGNEPLTATFYYARMSGFQEDYICS